MAHSAHAAPLATVPTHPSILSDALPTMSTVGPQLVLTPEVEPISEQSRLRPTSNPVLFVITAVVALTLLAASGILLFPHLTKATPQLNSASPPAAPAIDPRDTKDAVREVRLAQEAAEKLATTLRQAEANRELLENAEKDQVEDGIETYRRAAEVIDRNRLDAEQAFIIAAKQVNALPQEARDKAYEENDKAVSSIGVGWRTRLAQMLPKYISGVTSDSAGTDPAFVDALRALQPRH
jgi:hypothetical protein